MINLAWARELRADYQNAHRLLDDAQNSLEKLDDQLLLLYCSVRRASLARAEGRPAEAAELMETAIPLSDRIGNLGLMGYTFTILGGARRDLGQLERASALLERALVLWQELGSAWGIAACRFELGDLESAKGTRALLRTS